MWLEIEDELMLAPGFAAPANLDYAGYHQYVEEMLPPESPALYGLHPNAEIEFLTVTSNTLFRTLLEMQPGNALVSEELGQSTEDKVQGLSSSLLKDDVYTVPCTCLLYTSDAADDYLGCRSRWSPYH